MILLIYAACKKLLWLLCGEYITEGQETRSSVRKQFQVPRRSDGDLNKVKVVVETGFFWGGRQIRDIT